MQKPDDNQVSKSSKTYEILQTTADLERQKKIYNSVKLSLLPDKGAKLKDRIYDLENLLKDLTISNDDKSEKSSTPENNVQETRLHKNDFGCLKKTKAETSKASAFQEKDEKTKVNSSAKEKEETSELNTIKADKSKSKTEKDTDFSDSSNEPLNIFTSSASEILPSFHELSKKLEYKDPDPLKEIAQSPAFKTYRETKAIPKVKYTDAKPLFEANDKKKCLNPYSLKSIHHSLVNEEAIKKLHGSLVIFPDDCKEEKQPKLLKVSLMQHQIKALSWLIWREAQIPSGGILADDMGLGKTLTMIALILKQKENYVKDLKEKSDEYNTKGTLVICLASIMRQYESEIKKHCKKDSVQVAVYHGPERFETFPVHHIKKFDIVVTTYQTLLSDKKFGEKGDIESGLFLLNWDRIILDEAHTIKNYKSKTAEAVFSLKSSKKWCMTGTPIHNDFKDMYSLVKFLQFHPFDTYESFKRLTDDKSEDYVERRNMLVKSILLRRTKTQADESGKSIIEMVKKNMNVTFIDLSPEEQNVYDELNEKITEIVKRKVSGNTSKSFNNTSPLIVLLLRVQQCCCHLSLLNKETEESVDDSLSDISKALTSLSISNSPSQSSCSDSILEVTFSEYQSHSMYDKSVMSSKLCKLFEELDKIAEESNNSAKSVIVSQWVSMLELVEYHLKLKKKVYHMIAGKTKTEERQTMCEDFNYNSEGCKIMLLSLKAGGVGLNLVGANHLFLLDLHWNPALEMQACDRIHRVGQKNDVFIHKFVCRNTIEEKILALQNAKSNLALNALSGARKIKQGLSIEDFKMLFNV